jgi:hypothetical protein
MNTTRVLSLVVLFALSPLSPLLLFEQVDSNKAIVAIMRIVRKIGLISWRYVMLCLDGFSFHLYLYTSICLPVQHSQLCASNIYQNITFTLLLFL